MMPTHDHRARLYDVFADPDTDVETKVAESLELGADHLGLPIGFLTRIDEGVQEIVQSRGDHPRLQPGETCPLDRAYCRRTVEIDTPLAVHDVEDADAIVQEAVDTFQLGAYIGARIDVDDEPYGTICFASGTTRAETFEDEETHFVELLATLVGTALERRAYEAELDTRQEIYRATIDASFDLVFRVDDHGAFTYVSSGVESLLGYDAEHYIGHPFTEMLPDEQTMDLASEIYGAVMAGQSVVHYYFPLSHRAGDRVLVDIRVVPIYDPGIDPADRTPADIVGVQGMARDATDRRRRERMIQVLNRVLRHNLRNDLTVIRGYADIIRERAAGEDATYADKIIEKSETLTGLADTARQLEQTLSVSVSAHRIDLVPIVNTTADRVRDDHPELTLTVSTPETLHAVAAPDLELALHEVLENAARHTGPDPTARIEGDVDGTQAVIRITDDGPGLPAQERAVLETGEETPLVHGSGLGLWLVYWIVENLHGEIVVSDADPGTCIELRFRREPDTSERDA